MPPGDIDVNEAYLPALRTQLPFFGHSILAEGRRIRIPNVDIETRDAPIIIDVCVFRQGIQQANLLILLYFQNLVSNDVSVTTSNADVNAHLTSALSHFTTVNGTLRVNAWMNSTTHSDANKLTMIAKNGFVFPS